MDRLCKVMDIHVNISPESQNRIKGKAVNDLIYKYCEENLEYTQEDEREESNFVGFKITKETRRETPDHHRFSATLKPIAVQEKFVEIERLETYIKKRKPDRL